MKWVGNKLADESGRMVAVLVEDDGLWAVYSESVSDGPLIGNFVSEEAAKFGAGRWAKNKAGAEKWVNFDKCSCCCDEQIQRLRSNPHLSSMGWTCGNHGDVTVSTASLCVTRPSLPAVRRERLDVTRPHFPQVRRPGVPSSNPRIIAKPDTEI